MSILTIDTDSSAGAPLVLAVSRAGHAEPRAVGSRWVTFSGRERSGIRAELMVVPVVLTGLTAVTLADLRARFALGATRLCAGEVFNNALATVRCSGEITDEAQAGRVDEWTATLTLHEVENVGTSL